MQNWLFRGGVRGAQGGETSRNDLSIPETELICISMDRCHFINCRLFTLHEFLPSSKTVKTDNLKGYPEIDRKLFWSFFVLFFPFQNLSLAVSFLSVEYMPIADDYTL